nr:MAG TPA: Baseplate wedge protein [Caudoviricetes sp.]
MIYEKPKNEIFASDAKDGEIVDFPNVKRGWGVTENLGFIPPMEYFNAAFNRVDKSLAYQLQRGVGEWDKDLEYPIGAVVSLSGIIYVAKSQNTNKNPANEVTIWDIVATQKWCNDIFVKKSELKDGIPVGSYLLYSSNTNTPDGFLRCDGSALDKNAYSALFEVIGYTYGKSGDKFLLPNFSDGKFMRGTGGNAAALGTVQQDAINTKNLQIRSITTDNAGTRYIYGTNTTSDFRGVAYTYSNTGSDLDYKSVAGKDNADIFSSTKKADENRPYNMAVVVLIKY